MASSMNPDVDAFDHPRIVAGSDGLRLAIYDLGGEGPDLLLVHATGFCAGVWAPVAARLTGFRVTALDVRGHGRSEPPPLDHPPGMSWAGTGRDVLTAVDALGLTDPVAAGHSMGGASLLIAELDRPEVFRSLWGYEPIVFPAAIAEATDGSNPLAEGARRRRASFPSARAAFDNFASKPPFDALDPRSLQAYVHHGFEELPDGSVTLRCLPEVEASTYEMGSRHRTFERLGGITTPMTVARGRDELGAASLAPGIAAALPHGRLENHEDLGHFGPLEDPGLIAASIAAAFAHM